MAATAGLGNEQKLFLVCDRGARAGHREEEEKEREKKKV
jgi:hypothetical protein